MQSLASEEEEAFLKELTERKILLPTKTTGIYGRSGTFVQIMQSLTDRITRLYRSSDIEVLRFPPVLSRDIVEKVGYLGKFPNLLGCLCSFEGGNREYSALLSAVESGAQTYPHFSMNDLALTPAACYPIYPHLTGELPREGRVVDAESWCYRHEPSRNPMRTRSFLMREFIFAGSETQAVTWRDGWVERGATFLQDLGLEVCAEPASDPFFGPAERLMAAHQREQSLKFELLVAIAAPGKTAVMSANCHKEHFAELFDIYHEGSLAHTACFGFGLERITLALLKTHGLDTQRWSASLQEMLLR
jgi:seryl-tRNA synthetase